MEALFLVARVLHIGGALFWVGAAFTSTFFLEPTMKALGPDANRFTEYLVNRRRFPVAIALSGAITILAGAYLYWIDSGGLRLEWITSRTGIGFTIGAIAAIAAYVIGFIVIRPAYERLGSLIGELASQGGVPTDAQRGELEEIDARVKWANWVDAALLTAAFVTMAVARYLR